MGMYTELMMSTRVKDVPEVVAVLKYMMGQTESEPPLPEHPFFATTRWRHLFASCSYYFVPRTVAVLQFEEIGAYWVLISRTDLKNYDGEIEHFIDWIRPHLEADEDTMIGYSRYEEAREPTIYYGADEG